MKVSRYFWGVVMCLWCEYAVAQSEMELMGQPSIDRPDNIVRKVDDTMLLVYVLPPQERNVAIFIREAVASGNESLLLAIVTDKAADSIRDDRQRHFWKTTAEVASLFRQTSGCRARTKEFKARYNDPSRPAAYRLWALEALVFLLRYADTSQYRCTVDVL